VVELRRQAQDYKVSIYNQWFEKRNPDLEESFYDLVLSYLPILAKTPGRGEGGSLRFFGKCSLWLWEKLTEGPCDYIFVMSNFKNILAGTFLPFLPMVVGNPKAKRSLGLSQILLRGGGGG
jgi:hypothetical protein